MALTREYAHLNFRKQWDLSGSDWRLLGECNALVTAITSTPILPQHHQQLLNLSLKKGAQATTAIEGNTLTDEEIQRIVDGQSLPPSKEYQQIEVQNILDAFNILLNEVAREGQSFRIDKALLTRLHQMVGKGLGEHFDAVPGQFRVDNRIVGTYRCPAHEDVNPLIEQYCDWLRREFCASAQQSFDEIVIQAMVAHIYLEWIHPFGDGNGRTGRLLEYYILLRGGLPSIATLLLSNHYNLTRTEYYRQIDQAYRTRDLTNFIRYALLGFRDSLRSTLSVIQKSQFEITWQKHIYDQFAAAKIRSSVVRARRRNLLLQMPEGRALSIDEIQLLTPELARDYAKLSNRTVARDLESLITMGLVAKESKGYRAQTELVLDFMPIRRDDENSV